MTQIYFIESEREYFKRTLNAAAAHLGASVNAKNTPSQGMAPTQEPLQ